MPQIIPVIGQLVYYKARGSADGKFPKTNRTALITDVLHTQETPESPIVSKVRVAVLNPEGLFFSDWLDQGQESGQWDFVQMPQSYVVLRPDGTKDHHMPAEMGQVGSAFSNPKA